MLEQLRRERQRQLELGATHAAWAEQSQRLLVALHGAFQRPPARFGPGPHPTLVSVYGGPHVQRVVDGGMMTQTLRAQCLPSLGFLVFALDNRCSALSEGLLDPGLNTL